MKDAACRLGVTERHAWRLLAAHRQEGARALSHKGRGCAPHHAVPGETRDRVIRLARTAYAGVNPTHLTERLAERESLLLSRSTVRRILITAGMPSPRHRRAKRTRLRRERFPMEGMLLQMDGSDPPGWKGEGRNGSSCLRWMTQRARFRGACSIPKKTAWGTSSCFRESSSTMESRCRSTLIATVSSAQCGVPGEVNVVSPPPRVRSLPRIPPQRIRNKGLTPSVALSAPWWHLRCEGWIPCDSGHASSLAGSLLLRRLAALHRQECSD